MNNFEEQIIKQSVDQVLHLIDSSLDWNLHHVNLDGDKYEKYKEYFKNRILLELNKWKTLKSQ
jgi:hypothetical protein